MLLSACHKHIFFFEFSLAESIKSEFIHLLFAYHQKCWNGGCHEVIYKEGKQGEKAEVSQITQELHRKSVATGHME